MNSKLTLDDLMRRFKSILEQRKTTVALDTNSFKPFCNIEVPGLDLSGLPTPIINGYDIPALIIYQRIYSEDVMRLARSIQLLNHEYIEFVQEMFHTHKNLILPVEVKRELDAWVDQADLKGYKLWQDGEKQPFDSEMVNALVRIHDANPYFEPIFRVQYEYKKAVMDFLRNITSDQVADYRGHEKFSQVLHNVEHVKSNIEDKSLFSNSYVATHNRNDGNLRIISFDGGLHRIAQAFDPANLGDNIAIHVHRGYSLIRYRNAKRVIGSAFDQTFPETRYNVAS